MNILVLIPEDREVAAACFAGDTNRPVGETKIAFSRGHAPDARFDPAPTPWLRDAWGALAGSPAPDLVALVCPFAGTLIQAPVVVDDAVRAGLAELAPQAPEDLPVFLPVLDNAAAAFPSVRRVVFPETAFFADLPPGEAIPALDAETLAAVPLRRYGHHGLFHEAAAREMARRRGRNAPRVLSICLEPKPEVAAVLGERPVMVSGGATRLAGLPGHTDCGQLDPSTALKIAADLGWSPERIRLVLTDESGLLGLTGRAIALPELFTATDPEALFVKAVLEYRMLLFCGAGVAAMGGADVVAFSGRYVALAEQIGPWLQTRLQLYGSGARRGVAWEVFGTPRAVIVAESAAQRFAG